MDFSKKKVLHFIKLSIWVKSDDKINTDQITEYLQSQDIKIVYRSSHAPIIFVEIEAGQLNSLLSRDDVVSVDIT